jgi:curved DNA-binding protein CbpA
VRAGRDPVKSYYELLSVGPDASADDIKRAFRREIARYHPDKVAHLGPEFLQVAESRASELTEAYRILMDPLARVHYDEHGDPAPSRPAPPEPPSPEADAPPPAAEPEPRRASTPPPHVAFKQERDTSDAFVRRAAVARFREAAVAALGQVDSAPAPGFDAGYLARPKRALFGRSQPAVRVLARFVSRVDAAAVEEAWRLALKARGKEDGPWSVFLMGSGLAPAAELAGRIALLRRKKLRPSGSEPVVVPVDVRDWDALVPTEAPTAIRAILEKLRKPA